MSRDGGREGFAPGFSLKKLAQLGYLTEAEAEEIEEYKSYIQTKKYIEDEAKNKLGLVNKDEILIKPKEKD